MKKALISVYQKDGVLEFAAFLNGAGWELVSTGGTAQYLRGGGLPVTDVSSLTGFPECLDGRVKTLHPAVHAGLLARRDDAAHRKTLEELSLCAIDLVCVNLYPFVEKAAAGLSFDETIEFIDIGGPAMLRSAAKNFAGVLVLTDSADYPRAMAEITSGKPDMAFRKMLAGKVFNMTAAYDAAIARFLQAGEDAFPRCWTQPLEKAAALRYGENGHQKAALYYTQDRDGSLKNMEILGGKELSYNNIRDVDLAWKAVCSFGLPAAAHPPLGAVELERLMPQAAKTGGACSAVAVKHNTPCGIGSADTPFLAFLKAKACDPVSIFGGIVAFNGIVDAATAAKLDEIFLEIVAAPDFDPDALAILRRKKNLRILKMSAPPHDEVECVSVDGGLLVQDVSRRLFDKWDVVTKAAPPPEDIPELIFGLRSVCWVKSNAIAVVKAGALMGIGGGETNRIWAAELAIKRAAEKAALLAQEPEYAPLPPPLRDGRPPAVLASDAFFPFSDVVELAAAHGIRSIIQCGGSANDAASIEACDRHGVAMVFTGIRCFKH